MLKVIQNVAQWAVVPFIYFGSLKAALGIGLFTSPSLESLLLYWLPGVVAVVTVSLNYGRAITQFDVSSVKASDIQPDPIAKNFDLLRLGYSDRAAYLMSELAYFAYLTPNDFYKLNIDEGITKILENKDHLTADKIRSYLGRYEDSDAFKEILSHLKAVNIEYKEFRQVDSAEYYVLTGVSNRKKFVVFSFRGTDKNVKDWLLNANAKPKGDKAGNVHLGFYDSFQNILQQHLVDDIQYYVNGETKPTIVFLTGHSQGGVFAQMAAQQISEDVRKVCYTFGAPRFADYQYFRFYKTPVYRVVNSADIVPRLPTNLLIQLLTGVLIVIKRALTSSSSNQHPMLDKVIQFLEKMSLYRHWGDLRYLTDMKSGNTKQIEVYVAPVFLDRLRWFMNSIKINPRSTISSHSMKIYRNKLKEIAKYRNDR